MCIIRIVLWLAALLFMANTASSKVNDWAKRETLPAPDGKGEVHQLQLIGTMSEKEASEFSVSANDRNENANTRDMHQRTPSKKIVYCYVEGPEVSTLIRGKGVLKKGKAVIQLPEHYEIVTSDEGLTAQVTPAGNCQGLYVHELSTRKLVIEELNNGNSNVEFYYQVQGVKKGYENYTVFKTCIPKVGPEWR